MLSITERLAKALILCPAMGQKIKRRAVIIASPLKRGERGHLPGVEMDALNYRSFLLSPVGGSWSPNEIQVLWNPSAAEVAKVMQATLAHYVFSVFSGHGGTDISTRRAYVQLNSNEAVYLDRLAAKSLRQLAIIDACKTNGYSRISGLGDPEAHLQFKSALTLSQARKLFNHRISNANRGRIVMHSASPGQAALDAPEGGVFSQSLLTTTRDWGATMNHGSILPVPVAYRYSQ